MIDPDKFNFLWVVDWPLFEYSEEEDRFVAAHHPFTMPKESDIELLETQPEKVYAKAYDVVLNGYELGGGSLRIYQRELQEKMFKALGLDRLVMLLAKKDNIREVIAFPKNSKAADLMTSAPSMASKEQLAELSLEVDIEEK